MDATAAQVVEAAFMAHRERLVRHLCSITRDPDVAEDLAQDAFLRLAREIEAGRQPDDLGAWLHRVGSNLAMSRGRHLGVVDRRSGLLPRPAEPYSPEQVICAGEMATAVGAVLAQMSGTERRALALAANGYAGVEIAAEIGRTPGAVRTLLCRARAKIRSDDRLSALALA